VDIAKPDPVLAGICAGGGAVADCWQAQRRILPQAPDDPSLRSLCERGPLEFQESQKWFDNHLALLPSASLQLLRDRLYGQLSLRELAIQRHNKMP
jgi:hypothetical protein